MELQPQDFRSERAALALSRLSEQKDVVLVRPISLTYFPGEPLTLVVWSSWRTENLTDQTALEQLHGGKRAFAALLDEWEELRGFVGTRTVPVYLHEDYGTGSVRTAELLPNGEMKWLVDRR